MKLMIDIDDEQVLFDIKKRGLEAKTKTDKVIINALYNAIPLEEHGRLIDADVLGDYFWDNRSRLYTRKDLQIAIDNAPTIIEADKGE